MSTKNKNIAVVGTGYWGKNLVRNFSELESLYAICDSDAEKLENFKNQFNVAHAFQSYDDVLKNKDIDAVVIASPAAQHYEMTKAAIHAGKDVFVEKPVALKVKEATELAGLVETHKAILMVDHLLQYHPAVTKLKELIDAGKLGKLLYICSNRLNMGQLRSEENILWSFAPHDISVILSLVGKEPQHITALGEAYLQDKIYDTTITHLNFSDRLKAHIYVSWLHPFKEQKFVVIGSYGMAVFNDVEKDEKLTLYPHKIEWINQVPVANKAQKEVIALEQKEPLKEACKHFLECIKHRTTPKTDANEASRVLRVLEQAQKSLEQTGKQV